MGKKLVLNRYCVLLLQNNFSGGHLAYGQFINTISNHFTKYGIKHFVVSSVKDAEFIIQNHHIDFSINIASYNYFVDGEPLFETYGIHNFQWLMDNPLKLKLLSPSKFNHYIAIDKEFLDGLGNNNLWIPMVFPDRVIQNSNRETKILASLKFRSLEDIKNEFAQSYLKNNIIDFIQTFDYDKSFIEQFRRYVSLNKIKNQIEFFKYTNSYIRANKRIMILNSIKEHDIVLLSNRKISDIHNPRVTFMNEKTFAETTILQQKFKFVLNVNPNYDETLHDRVSYAIKNGAIIISDKNKFLKRIDMPGCFSYYELDNIDNIINELPNNISEIQNCCISRFDFVHSFKKIIKKFEEINNEL